MTRLWIVVPLVASLVVVGAAQQLSPQTPPQTPPVFRSGTERVRVDVTVSDRGRPVTGLSADDFEIKDNGVVASDLEIAVTTGAVSVAVALDLGATVQRDGWQEMIQSCEALIEALEPRDTAWLLTFSKELALKAGPVRNKFALTRALSSLERGPGSSVWDALFGSIALVSGQSGRSLVLVFSDGQDSTSFLDEKRAMEVLRRSDVVVTAVRPPHQPFGFIGLENAVNTTGGLITEGKKGDAGRKVLADILDGFRRGYVLTYRPPVAPEPKDGWHEIEVSLKKKRGEVRARKGYYSEGR